METIIEKMSWKEQVRKTWSSSYPNNWPTEADAGKKTLQRSKVELRFPGRGVQAISFNIF